MAKNIGFNIHLSINGQDVVVNCKKGVQDLGRALGTIPGAAGKAGSAIQAMGAVSSSLRGVYDGINSLKTVCSELTGAYKTQEENEIKLETVMRHRFRKQVSHRLSTVSNEHLLSNSVIFDIALLYISAVPSVIDMSLYSFMKSSRQRS